MTGSNERLSGRLRERLPKTLAEGFATFVASKKALDDVDTRRAFMAGALTVANAMHEPDSAAVIARIEIFSAELAIFARAELAAELGADHPIVVAFDVMTKHAELKALVEKLSAQAAARQTEGGIAE